MPTMRQNVVAALTRCYPFYSGCGTLANHPLLQKLAGPSTERVWTRVPGGEVLAPLDDHVGRAAFFLGDLDRKIRWLCTRIVRPGDTVLDAGANLGLVTLWLAQLAGKTGRVHSFEPNPELCALLEQVIARNGLTNTMLHPLALGSRPEQLVLRAPGRNLGMGTLLADKSLGIDLIHEHTVAVETLSEIAVREKIGHVRLLKIDVEGFEFEVLRGAEPLLREQRIDAILFELNEAPASGQPHPLPGYLEECGYRLFSIPRCLTRMRLRPVDAAQLTQTASHDLLAVTRPIAELGFRSAEILNHG